MKRYFLDTCALIWLLEGNKRVAKLAESIRYCSADFAVPIDAMKELIYLKTSGKLKTKLSFKEILKFFTNAGIKIYLFEAYSLEALYNLPFFSDHTDPNDRSIVAQSIAERRILVSGDEKFDRYKKYGLELLSI